MMDQLTEDKLKAMEPNTVFAQGEVENSPEGIYMTDSDKSRKLLWVAQRGYAPDWTIYIHWADKGAAYVLSQGDKVFSETNIKKLVPCDKDAFKLYRY